MFMITCINFYLLVTDNMHIIATTYDQIISECGSNFELNGLCMGRVWLGWVWGNGEGKGWKNSGVG